jgi:hypothetical protein
LSAIFGAVWLDQEKRNESVSNTRVKIFSILRQIDVNMDLTTEDVRSTTGDRAAAVSEEDDNIQRTVSSGAMDILTLNEAFDQDINALHGIMFQEFDQNHYTTVEEANLALFPLNGAGWELDYTSHSNVQSR